MTNPVRFTALFFARAIQYLPCCHWAKLGLYFRCESDAHFRPRRLSGERPIFNAESPPMSPLRSTPSIELDYVYTSRTPLSLYVHARQHSEGASYFALPTLDRRLLRLSRHLYPTTMAAPGAMYDGAMAFSCSVTTELENGCFAKVVIPGENNEEERTQLVRGRTSIHGPRLSLSLCWRSV